MGLNLATAFGAEVCITAAAPCNSLAALFKDNEGEWAYPVWGIASAVGVTRGEWASGPLAHRSCWAVWVVPLVLCYMSVSVLLQ